MERSDISYQQSAYLTIYTVLLKNECLPLSPENKSFQMETRCDGNISPYDKERLTQ